MAYALTEIQRTRGERIGLDAVSRDGEPAYQMIARARTAGCFQIESPGQRELVKKLAPRGIGGLITGISLFRPGPASSGMVTLFLRVRHGVARPRYPHRTCGTLRRDRGSGGLPRAGAADHRRDGRLRPGRSGLGPPHAGRRRRPRRAWPWFRATALRRGYAPVTVDRVWQMAAAFGGFGFCKAHAAACAIPVSQPAWLKRHYPAAFYAGVLTHDPGMYPKRLIVHDARLAGIPVLGLDVNASGPGWLVQQPSSRTEGWFPEGIRVSLREVKGISDAEVDRIVAAGIKVATHSAQLPSTPRAHMTAEPRRCSGCATPRIAADHRSLLLDRARSGHRRPLRPEAA